MHIIADLSCVIIQREVNNIEALQMVADKEYGTVNQEEQSRYAVTEIAVLFNLTAH